MAGDVAPAEDDGLHGLPTMEETVTELRYAVGDFHGCKNNKALSVAAKLFLRKICFKAFFSFGRVIYPPEKENALSGLKTALKKAARFRTPPKTFSFIQSSLPSDVFIP